MVPVVLGLRRLPVVDFVFFLVVVFEVLFLLDFLPA